MKRYEVRALVHKTVEEIRSRVVQRVQARMKLLHIVWWGELGGVAMNLVDFAKGYCASNCTLEVCVIRSSSDLIDNLSQYGVHVTEIGARSGVDLLAFLRLCTFLRRNAFDIVHNHTSTFFVEFALLLGARRAKKVCQEHGSIRRRGRRAFFYYRIFRNAYDRFVAVSESTAADLISAGVPADRVLTIANPVDSAAFSPNISRDEAKRRLGVPISAQVIGTACRFAPEKDLALFLEVAANIATTGREVVFVMAGAGTELAALEDRAKELKLQRHVRFIGVQSDMPTVWRAIDIYLFTSRGEAFGRTILESLAAETPIVAAVPYDGGAIDLIHRGQGILADEHRDPQRLAMLVSRLLDSPREREELGHRGRLWAIDNYDRRKWIQHLQHLYESLCPAT